MNHTESALPTPEGPETGTTGTSTPERRHCWQVDEEPMTVYLDPEGLPVEPSGDLRPWLATTPCTDLDGTAPPPVAVLRRKLYRSEQPDYFDDPEAATWRDGRVRSDEMHLLKNAPRFQAEIARLPLAEVRAASLEEFERALDQVSVIVRDPRHSEVYLYVVAKGGCDRLFGELAGVFVVKPCFQPRRRRCCPRGCRVVERPPQLQIASIQPADGRMTGPAYARKAASTIAQHLVATNDWSHGNQESMDRAAVRILNTIPPKPRRRPRAAPSRTLRAIKRYSNAGSIRKIWVEGGHILEMELPEEARSDPESFFQRHGYIEFVEGVPRRFATGREDR